MIYSDTTEYAIRGMSELASRAGEGKSLMLDQLVAGTDLPRDFLAKIFQRLVRNGLLTSAKGRGGGFALARPAAAISLLDIIEAMEGRKSLDDCVVGLERCNDQMPCPQHDTYKPIRTRLKQYMESTTLADLSASLKAKQAWQRVEKERAGAGGGAAAAANVATAPKK